MPERQKTFTDYWRFKTTEKFRNGSGERIGVLYVVFELFAGGMENGIVNLINRSSDRFRHVVCCLKEKGEFAERLRPGTKVYELDKKYGNDYRLPFRLLRVIRKERIGIVRAFNEDPYFYSIFPAKLMRVPIIYYNGGRTLPEIKRRLFLERLFGNLASKVIVPSEGLKAYLAAAVGINKDRIRVIHNGVDVNRFVRPISSFEKRKELGIPEGDTVVGTVGRLVPQKDIPCFLDVARKLLSVQDNITFIIVGDGVLREELESLSVRMGLDRKVRFLGIRHDIEEIYSAMDFFLLTARWEGMSNVLLEAMASKKVVISTDVEGTREIIRDGEDGFIVAVGDVDGIMERILSLDRDKRVKIGERAFAKIKNQFSIERMVQYYEDLYLEISGNRKQVLLG